MLDCLYTTAYLWDYQKEIFGKTTASELDIKSGKAQTLYTQYKSRNIDIS